MAGHRLTTVSAASVLSGDRVMTHLGWALVVHATDWGGYRVLTIREPGRTRHRTLYLPPGRRVSARLPR